MRARLAAEIAPLVTTLDGHPWERGFLLGGGATGRLKGAAGSWRAGMTLDRVLLSPDRVCEAAYTQLDGHRLRHPARFRRWRPDREPSSLRIRSTRAARGDARRAARLTARRAAIRFAGRPA